MSRIARTVNARSGAPLVARHRDAPFERVEGRDAADKGKRPTAARIIRRFRAGKNADRRTAAGLQHARDLGEQRLRARLERPTADRQPSPMTASMLAPATGMSSQLPAIALREALSPAQTPEIMAGD